MTKEGNIPIPFDASEVAGDIESSPPWIIDWLRREHQARKDAGT